MHYVHFASQPMKQLCICYGTVVKPNNLSKTFPTGWVHLTFNAILLKSILFFCLQRGHNTDKIFNFIMLYAKYYIYLAKCKNQQLFISVFQNKLQIMYRVHKQIAFSKNEEENFQADWSPYMRPITSIT